MRRRLSDTAARMFLERGFDAVRVVDVAEECGVSDKTVFNYFPTKEALLLDRLETTSEALAEHLASPDRTPLEATVGILADELASTAAGFSGEDVEAAIADYRRFGEMIASTPALRIHTSAMLERFVLVAADALARRAGVPPDDPELLIAAAALVGLWRVQFNSLRRHLAGADDVDGLVRAVTADVERAAQLLERGLGDWWPNLPDAEPATSSPS
ncbi:TetR family transcriptional regulator [Pseudonocardia sp. CA-107938]|uniref:TetR family transcriptional regulator n=1 Tax=Pseudonocardia sp. CA-107938 TaxID=3240021 RepID=UPI003D9134EF